MLQGKIGLFQRGSATGKNNLLQRAFRLARPAFVTAIIFSFFINLLVFVSPLYMLQIYDRVISSRNQYTLLMLTLIAAFLLIVYATLEKVRSAVLVRVGLLFDAETRSELFEKVLRGSLKQPGIAHYTVLRELDTLREFMTGGGLISFCDVPWVPIFVAGCFILHPWYGWVASAGAILIFVFAYANELLTRDQLKEAGRSANQAGGFAAATFRNVEVLHAMGMWRPMRERWLEQRNGMLESQAIASDRAGFLLSAAKFLRVFLQVAILGTGAYLSIIQESTPGAMIAASIIMGRALAPVEMVVAQWRLFLAARAAYERITQLLTIVPEQPERMKLPAPQGHLTVQQIIVAPPGVQRPVLNGISFDLPAGSAMGLIGPSAAGKSSLARAIVGVWPVLAGSIRIDGADLTHWDTDQLGQYIGYLPQDVELFSATVAENIARFQTVDNELVIEAAQMAGVHDMILSMPNGYNTQIGDGGQSLSGGQRQRIGLARALYRMPSLVILDEPNASLDADGEAALLGALQRLKAEKRTVILITHKTNILSVMDKILVLAQGQMQAFGERDEIFSKLLAPRVAAVGSPPHSAVATR
jgi:ATP-binding cassette subfamily C protein